LRIVHRVPHIKHQNFDGVDCLEHFADICISLVYLFEALHSMDGEQVGLLHFWTAGGGIMRGWADI
jgi:hypothetical protein